MPKVFLNKEVAFKKAKYTCAYNTATGFYFWPEENFVKFLKSLSSEREFSALEERYKEFIPELLLNRFLLLEGEEGGYEEFFPTVPVYKVYYKHDDGTDVAVDRVGKFKEMDFEVLTLTGRDEKLWHSCNGENTVAEISSELGRDFVSEKLRTWASLELQIIRLLPQPLAYYTSTPAPLINPAPFIPNLKVAPHGQATDVKKYHFAIAEGYQQFETVESTLSHLYRVPHPIFNWKSYGEALFDKVKELKEVKKGCRILEIGGGHGDISKNILSTANDVFYAIYDLSPELIRSQRKLHKGARVKAEHIHGDAERLALRDSSVDIVLSNEVIADLSTPEITAKELKKQMEKYRIPLSEKFLALLKNAPRHFRINMGAFRVIKEVERVLKRGGIGIITEYGSEDRLPFVAKHLDHAEYAIHFGQLAAVAEALGLKTQLTDAFKFLNFNPDIKLITQASFQAAYRILEQHGTHLPNIAYTHELFERQLGEKARTFKNIQYVKCAKEPIEIVKVLICEKEA